MKKFIEKNFKDSKLWNCSILKSCKSNYYLKFKNFKMNFRKKKKFINKKSKFYGQKRTFLKIKSCKSVYNCMDT